MAEDQNGVRIYKLSPEELERYRKHLPHRYCPCCCRSLPDTEEYWRYCEFGIATASISGGKCTDPVIVPDKPPRMMCRDCMIRRMEDTNGRERP